MFEYFRNAYGRLLTSVFEPVAAWVLSQSLPKRIFILLVISGCIAIWNYPAATKQAGAYSLRAFRILLADSNVIPLDENLRARILAVRSRLAAANINDVNMLATGDMTGWSAAQALLATGRQGKPSIEEEKLIQYIHATRLPACNCWAELNSDDQRQAWTFVTGWVLTALASKHQAASEGELAFLLRQQNPDGSWTSIPAQGLIEYASVFATSWSIIGLHEQLTAGLITDEAVAKKMSDAIQRGAEWLAQKRQSNARWKAYPNLQSNSESDSLSGLAVHALHITRPDLIGEIYEDWLDNLPQSPVPASLGENTYVEIKRVGTVQIDHFVQLKMPWMLIATVDAYGNGSIFQKVRALTWIERTLSHESIKNADTEPKNWWRAELLIALNYVLQHAQAGHGRQASLSTRRSRSATA